jgi:16S rRNA A1518/A1519 N6-dimethyltransferase RsmA/KsgA/DIM1 with predicted DNA glycosylase/AP lyase activity
MLKRYWLIMASADRGSRWGIAPERVMMYAKKGFAHPRKMLMSNLQLTPQQRTLLETQGFAPTIRAEALDVQAWVKLAKALEGMRSDVMSSNDER